MRGVSGAARFLENVGFIDALDVFAVSPLPFSATDFAVPKRGRQIIFREPFGLTAGSVRPRECAAIGGRPD
jgi:hypothetical protein